MFKNWRKRRNSGSGTKVHRDGDVLVYNEVGSGSSSSSSSSSGDEEAQDQASTGAFPSANDRSPSRVPDPWSQQQQQDGENNKNNNRRTTTSSSEEEGDEPTPRQAELLEAWMNKRREIRLEEQQQKMRSMMDPRTGGFQTSSNSIPGQQQQPLWFAQHHGHAQAAVHHHPVDVDTGVEILHKYEEDDDNALYLPTAMATIVGEDCSGTVVSKPGSIASYPSNATSDMTPVVSNTKFKHRPSPSIAHSLTTTIEAPESAAGAEGGGAGGASDTNSGSTAAGGCAKQCQAFLDVRTIHGKLALLLLTILVLAVTTMVVSALLARQSRSIIDRNSGGGGTTPFVTRSPITSTPSVAPSPTVAPTTANDTSRPTAVGETRAPTAGPSTTAPTTAMPTAQPSATPTTVQPTTAAPTTYPTTLAPTNTPTVAPSTAAPTLEPLENLVLVLGDSVQGPTDDDAFGTSVALSGNGLVMVVGAPNYSRRLGRVEIYELQNVPGDPVPRQWVQRDVLVGTVPQGTLGQSVAVSRDGLIIAVSEPGVDRRAGRVTMYAYNPTSGSYRALGNPIVGTAGASYSGTALSLSSDGLRVAVGAPYYTGVNDLQLHGQVVVYELEGNEWVPMGNPISGEGTLDWLGSAVALSEDGNRVVASAPWNSNLDGYVGTWEWNSATQDWVRWGSGDIFNDYLPSLSSDRFGHSVAMSTTQEGVHRLAVGVPWKSVAGQRNAGMAVVFELDPLGNRWVQLGEPIVDESPVAHAEAGNSIDFIDGTILLVGAPGAAERAGQVRLYRFDERQRQWEVHPVSLTGRNEGDDFGVSLAAQREVEIDQGISLVVGAISQNRGSNGYVQSFVEE